MTDRLEAARAFVAAGDALNSPEHQADVEQLREISNRVTARQEAYDAAQEALFAADRTCAPADNVQAEAVLFGGSNGVSPPVPPADEPTESVVDVEQYFRPIFGTQADEFSSSRANGAYAED